jgi:hypothetical protein
MLGRSQLGEGVLPGFSPSFSRGVLPAPGRVRAKKRFRSCRCLRKYRGVQLPGSGATLLCYHLFSRKRAFRSQQQAFRACGGRTRAQPHGLTRFPGFSAVCRPGSPHRSVIVLRVRNPARRSSRSGGAGHRVEVRGRPRPGLLLPGSPGWGIPAPGQTRIAVHEDEDGPPGATAISRDFRPSRAPPDSACHPPQTDGVGTGVHM